MTYRRSLQNLRRFCRFLIFFGAVHNLSAATFLVTTTADTGLGSLRNAIDIANATPGADMIAFNIPGAGAQTITVNSNLPPISDRLTIDGTTQPGYAGKPLIVLRASGSSYYGLQLNPGSCAVRGLTVNGFASVGIYVFGSSNIIESCFVGTDATGTASRPNGIGILLSGSSYNTIGGSDAGNVISGNADLGLCLNFSSGNVVQGNFIGTDANGTNALGNVNDGISIDHAPNNEIGGTGSGEGNLISGNRRDGIRFIDQSATGNVIEGNIIGLDITGRAGLGNNRNGIYLATALNNTIGGTDHGSRNLISGNNAWAIVVDNVGNGNVLQGNWIGLDILGSYRVPNGGGINCVAAQTSIGGTEPGAGNLISGNMNEGILLGGSNNVVQGNLIGTDASGTFAVPNGILLEAPFGIRVSGSAHTIGGDTPEARNIISGNISHGLMLEAARGCVVQGNWIGLSASAKALGNGGDGILVVYYGDNIIGGSNPGEGNICSANGAYGILLLSSSNQVLGNFIGLAPDGQTARGNRGGGIDIRSASNSVGGPGVSDGNVISGNGGGGILVTFFGGGDIPSLNAIQGNLIGLDAAGQNPIPNLGPGIDVAAPVTSLQIGGTGPGEANRIAFNRGNGVLVRSNAVGVTIAGNSIYANNGIAINLQPPGEPANTITTNDNLDADNGPNRLQNFPVITNTVYAGGVTVISGYLRSVTNEDFDIELFVSDLYPYNGYSDAQTYLDTTGASTDSSGFGEFQFIVPGSFGTEVFTTTATRSNTGDTSEFSRAVATLDGLLRITDIHRSNADIQISFTTKAGTNYRVEVTTQLHNPSSWTPVSGASNVSGTGSVVSVKDLGAAAASQRFYRIIQL